LTYNLQMLSLETHFCASGLSKKPTFPSSGPEVGVSCSRLRGGEEPSLGVFQLARLETDCLDCVLSTLQVLVSCPSFELGGVGDVLLG